MPYELEFTLVDGGSGYRFHLLDPAGHPLTLDLPCDATVLGGCQNQPYRPISPVFMPSGDILFGLTLPDALPRVIRYSAASEDWDVLIDAIPGAVINLVADGDDVLVASGGGLSTVVTPFFAPDYAAGRVAELATLTQDNHLVKTETGGLYTVGNGGLLELTR